MMTDSSPSRSDAPDDDAWLPDLIRRLEAIYAAREAANPTPAPPHPPEPWADKPGSLIAAEKDVLRWEMIEKLQHVLCGDVRRCDNHRCRRRGRCGKLAEMAADMEASRANLTAERANWQPPPAPPAEPRCGRRKARSEERQPGAAGSSK